jgi:hypothetical protein
VFSTVALDTVIPLPMDQVFNVLYCNDAFRDELLVRQKLTGEPVSHIAAHPI